MIVTCPSCSTRYLVDPAAIGQGGRRVKCARCGHLWRESSVEPVAAPTPPEPQPVLVGGLAGVGYFARDSIVRFWPPAIRLYDTIGVPVAQPVETGALGRGLVLQNLEVRRVAGSGVEQVVVTGRVENRALVTRPVPPIEVRLLDASRTVVARTPLVVTTESLAPDQSVQVAVTLESMPDAATRLEIGAQTGSGP